MADETAAERDERIADELTKQYEEEGQTITDAAEGARADQPAEEGLTKETYWEHTANVPGIFGSTPTDQTTGARDSVVTKNEAVASEDVAVVDANAQAGDEKAQEATTPEAVRQIDAAAPSGATAEEADAAATDSGENQDAVKDDNEKKSTSKSKK